MVHFCSLVNVRTQNYGGKNLQQTEIKKLLRYGAEEQIRHMIIDILGPDPNQ